MKSTAAVLLAGLALGVAPTASHALEEQLRVALPERHELVELQPGLQVIPAFDLEVFYTGSAYWLRSGGAWYTTRRPAVASTFTLADPRSVPAALARLPDGSHLDYRPAPGQPRATKVLTTMEAPEREAVAVAEAEAARIEPAPAKPAAAAVAKPAGQKPAAQKPANAKPATARPAATAKPAAARTATKAPAPKKQAPAPATP